MDTDNDRVVEYPEFSGEFTEGGMTVRVLISRPAETLLDWTLTVLDQAGGSTTWEDGFATEREAFDEFLATVERDGLASFLDDGDPPVH